jgi:anti-sigma factor RsiW
MEYSVAKHDERHLTTEKLSAYIDKQLSAQEQAACAAHLQSCAQCQQALLGLQQTVALLRALPQPSLPRSFTLPAGASYLQERPSLQALPTAPTPHLTTRQTAWQRYMRGSLRAVSTIAAVLGLIFLLSGLVITLPRGGSGSATSATSNTASSGTSPRYAQDITAKSATATSVAHQEQANDNKNTRVPGSKPTPTIVEPVRTPAVVSQATPTPEQPQPAQPLAGLFTPLGLQLGGFILFALGIVGVLLTRRRQRDRATP